MILTATFDGRPTSIVALFEATFTASSGADEGVMVGKIAADLLSGTPAGDLRTFFAIEDHVLVGAVFFSRLAHASDPRRVFLLSPMAVGTPFQRRGVGCRLIRYALDSLTKEGIEIAVTYGDPAYYERLGFRPLSPDLLPPPYPLSQPQVWLGRSLTGQEIAAMVGPPRCVPAFDDPAYW